MAGEGGADAIMAAEDLRPLLNLSKRQPVGCAVALTKDKQAILLLHRTMRPRKVMADLRKQAVAAKVDLDLQTLRFGRATVDGGSDSQCVNIAVNKEVPNAGSYELKLRERLKPAGFRRCGVTVDAALEGEPDDAADQPGAAPGASASVQPAGASPSVSPSPVAGAPPQGTLAPPVATLDSEGPASGTAPPAAQAPVPGVVPAPPQDASANADDWRPKARTALTTLAQQVSSSTERDTPRRLELSGMADQVNIAIKEGDQAGATARMQALRQALGNAGSPDITPVSGPPPASLPAQADPCPPSDYERGMTEAAEAHRTRTVAGFQQQYDEARANPFGSRVGPWEAQQNLERARDAPTSHFVDSGMMDRGRMNAIQAGRQNMRELSGFGPEAEAEACRRVQAIGPDSTDHGVLGLLGEGVETVAPAAIGVLGGWGGVGARPPVGRTPSNMRPQAGNGQTWQQTVTLGTGRMDMQGRPATLPPEVPSPPGTAAANRLVFAQELTPGQRVFSRQAGKVISGDPVARGFYARLQARGTHVHFTNDPERPEWGSFDPVRNKVDINMSRNMSVSDTVRTFVHEGTHGSRFSRGVNLAQQYEEYLAARNEALVTLRRRPNLEERMKIWQRVQMLYPELPEGRNPFGGTP